MAPLGFIFAYLIVVAQAGFARQDNNQYNQPRFPQMRMPFFPNFPNFPNFPFGNFPFFAPSSIHVPTPEEIASMAGKPGVAFSGVVVNSGTGMRRDEHGNMVSVGGSTITTNQNGVVHTVSVDNSNLPGGPNGASIIIIPPPPPPGKQ